MKRKEYDEMINVENVKSSDQEHWLSLVRQFQKDAIKELKIVYNHLYSSTDTKRLKMSQMDNSMDNGTTVSTTTNDENILNAQYCELFSSSNDILHLVFIFF